MNLLDRRGTLLTDHIDKLFAAIEYVKSRHPFEVPVWAVLPDHLHCIWILPEHDADFSKRWRLIKTNFSRALPKTADAATPRRLGERGIWQRRFWEHLARDTDDLLAAIDYIHTNAVKHEYVDHPKDWPHSSWHGFEGEIW